MPALARRKAYIHLLIHLYIRLSCRHSGAHPGQADAQQGPPHSRLRAALEGSQKLKRLLFVGVLLGTCMVIGDGRS